MAAAEARIWKSERGQRGRRYFAWLAGVALCASAASGCAHWPAAYRDLQPFGRAAAEQSRPAQSRAKDSSGSAPHMTQEAMVPELAGGNPLRGEADEPAVTSVSYQETNENSGAAWMEPVESMSAQEPSTASPPPAESNEPLNIWIDQPERTPPATNAINASHRHRVNAALGDTADGYLKQGPGYQPRNLQQPALTATEYALQLQRENQKLLEKIAQLERQQKLEVQRTEAEAEAHAATRAELEQSQQLVARLSYAGQQLESDRNQWMQKFAQLEKRYRDYTRGVEESLDEMLLQAWSRQSQGGQ